MLLEKEIFNPSSMAVEQVLGPILYCNITLKINVDLEKNLKN